MNVIDFQNSCRKKICALLLALAVTAVPISGALAGTAEEGPQANSVPEAKVSIKAKMIEAVVTITGERYKISEETIITDLNGKQVNIRKMLVPCDAEITFQTEKGVRVAQRIKVIRIGSKSTWHWKAEQPE
ncbi:MAG: hypothetical protein PVH87_23365 [Desulfobacteraceae bacterium]|jgi:hypothetical protein